MRKNIDRALFLSLTLSGLALAACSSDVIDDTTDAGDEAGDTPDTGVHNADGGKKTDAGHDATPAVDSGEDATLSDDAGQDAGVDAQEGDANDSGAPDVLLVPDSGDAGAPGSPCTQENAIQQQSCGMCGTQTRVCLADTSNVVDAGDGGGDPDASAADAGDSGLKWQPWGFCQGQPANACQPGQQTSEACGLCGHRSRVCQLDCQWAIGPCQGEPTNACAPGSTNYVAGLSCTSGGRDQTCKQDCTWGPFGPCHTPAFGGPIVIPGGAGGTLSQLEMMADSPTLPRLTRTKCPTTVYTAGSKNAYTWIELQNPSSQSATVSVWFSQATGGANINTEIAVYPGNVPPTTDAARITCAFGVTDSCFSSTAPASACKTGWGGLVAGDTSNGPITIGPSSSVIVYAGAVEEVTSPSPHSGSFMINLRTESFQ